MERYINLEEISDGRLYDLNDMVKADCGDCTGCSACCQGMGSSIVLDPMDVYHLCQGMDTTFEELLGSSLELHVEDGIILPNLKMAGQSERCSFLNEAGRCSIHPFRPGICRLFPLGRIYEANSFRYFLQVHECRKETKTKVKVKKWIDMPDAVEYGRYIGEWHYFLKELQKKIKENPDEELTKIICMSVLSEFYVTPYDTDRDFYSQFYVRLERQRKHFISL